MSTRRTRNNPSPSGLKSLPYGPQKKGEKTDRKTRIVSQPSTTSVATTSEKKPAPNKKRARAASKADKNPPAKRRTLRTRQAKTVDEDHDADDDEDVEDMLVVQTDYNPPQPPSPFHVAEKRLEGRQTTEEFSSEEQHTHSDNLQITYPEQHSSEEYYSQRATSHESASEERHLEQDSQGYNSQDDDLSRDAASVPKHSQAQPTETPASYVHKPYFLTPKPRQKPKTASISYSKSVDPKPTSTEPSAEAVKEREDLYQRMFGAKIPSQWQDTLKQTIGHSSPKPVESREEEQDDGDSDKSFSFLDEPKLTSAEWASWREQQKRFRGQVELPQTPTGRLETKRKPAAKASEPRPSTTISKSKNTTSPTCHSEAQFVLTRPDLIDAARALVKWAERDDTHRVPNAEQMEALLDGFNTEEAAKVTPRSRSQPSSTRSQPSSSRPQPSSRAARRHHPYSKTVASPRTAQHRPHRDEPMVSDQEGKDAINSASAENQSEVPNEKQPPQTPTPPPQESRGFWNGVSAVASIFTSPLQFFDRRRNQQDSPMATTNSTAVMGISATTQSADDPFTPMKFRPRPKTSQSERKRQPQSVRNRGPQTERRRNSRDQPKPPIHLRGIVSPSRIAEIHRQQDRLAAARNKKRAAYAEEADAEEDSDAERPSMTGAKTGEKRKRTKGAVRTPPAGPPGTFRVPSPGSSDDSSDEEEQTIVQQSPGRVRYTPIPVTPRKDLIDDYSANSSPFTSISGRPATSTVWNAPPDFEPTYKEYSRTSPKSKISPKSKASAKMKPSTSPSPTKKSRAAAKLVQDTPLQSIDFGESDSSFKVPDTGNSSDSDEEEIATPKTGDAAQTKSSEPDPSVLQSKQWTQTPPPKPRPSNAQLPQFPPPLSAAEAAKAKAEKFKPKQPSSLRNVTQMSPLQIEKENLIVRDHITSHTSFAMLLEESGISKVEWEKADAMQDNFFRNADPDVIAAVNALPDSQIAEYPLPPSLSETLLGLGQSEVEKEVEKYFR